MPGQKTEGAEAHVPALTDREAMDQALLIACTSTLVTREVSDLLAAGADPDGPAKKGLPLRRAVQKDNPSLCSLFILAGANPNLTHDLPAKNDLRGQPHFNLSTPPVKNNLRGQLHFNLSTPLHFAAYMGFTGCVIALIAGGADRSIRSQNADMTAEAVALALGHEWTARAIAFPLHAAAVRGEVVHCLSMLDNGFDPHQKNRMRQTAQRVAQIAGHDPVVAAIQSWVSRAAAMSALKDTSLPASFGRR